MGERKVGDAVNVERRHQYNQVAVWPGTLVVGELTEPELQQRSIDGFEKWILEDLGVRIQYLEEVTTSPGAGGRVDALFAVHAEDVLVFATKRLAYGMRWIEDVLAEHNGEHEIYPQRLDGYCSWPAGQDEEE